jgi:hypothetical protein
VLADICILLDVHGTSQTPEYTSIIASLTDLRTHTEQFYALLENDDQLPLAVIPWCFPLRLILRKTCALVASLIKNVNVLYDINCEIDTQNEQNKLIMYKDLESLIQISADMSNQTTMLLDRARFQERTFQVEKTQRANF